MKTIIATLALLAHMLACWGLIELILLRDFYHAGRRGAAYLLSAFALGGVAFVLNKVAFAG